MNMKSLRELEKRVCAIERRNKRVELDKEWETSFARKVIIAVLTYIVLVLFFIFAGLEKPFVNSIVPTAAFVLSTLSLPYFKRMWLSKRGLSYCLILYFIYLLLELGLAQEILDIDFCVLFYQSPAAPFVHPSC